MQIHDIGRDIRTASEMLWLYPNQRMNYCNLTYPTWQPAHSNTRPDIQTDLDMSEFMNLCT